MTKMKPKTSMKKMKRAVMTKTMTMMENLSQVAQISEMRVMEMKATMLTMDQTTRIHKTHLRAILVTLELEAMT